MDCFPWDFQGAVRPVIVMRRTLVLMAVALLVGACGADDGADDGATAAEADTSSGDIGQVEQDTTDLGSDSDDGSSQDDASTEGEISLRFAVVAWEKVFTCNAPLSGLGNSGGVLSASDMRFYIHDVALHSSSTGDEVPLVLEEDGKWQGSGVALLDFEDKTGTCTNGTEDTRDVVIGTAPADTYDGVRFTLGVPAELNHLDVSTALPPLNISGLYWSWQGGYKYLRLDGETEDPSFRVHLGATECDIGGPGEFTCDRENLAEILLTGFNPDENVIVLDLAELLAGDDVNANTPDTPAGCMAGGADPDCYTVFDSLGITPASPQTAFRVGELAP